MQKQQEDIIKLLQARLSSLSDVSFAYLFGSYASGKVTSASDIDVAVYLKSGVDTFEEGLQIHHRLEIALRRDIDLIVLNDVKNYRLLKDVIDNGIVIKDNQMRPFYEVQKKHEIIDFLIFKRMVHAR